MHNFKLLKSSAAQQKQVLSLSKVPALCLFFAVAAGQTGETALFVVNYSSSLLFLITIAAPAAVIRKAILAIMPNDTG